MRRRGAREEEGPVVGAAGRRVHVEPLEEPLLRDGLGGFRVLDGARRQERDDPVRDLVVRRVDVDVRIRGEVPGLPHLGAPAPHVRGHLLPHVDARDDGVLEEVRVQEVERRRRSVGRGADRGPEERAALRVDAVAGGGRLGLRPVGDERGAELGARRRGLVAPPVARAGPGDDGVDDGAEAALRRGALAAHGAERHEERLAPGRPVARVPRRRLDDLFHVRLPGALGEALPGVILRARDEGDHRLRRHVRGHGGAGAHCGGYGARTGCPAVGIVSSEERARMEFRGLQDVFIIASTLAWIALRMVRLSEL